MDYLIILVNVLIIIFLVMLNGFFVAAEFSIVKIRPSRLDTLLKEGVSGADSAKEVTSQLDAYLSVTQLGITIASLGLGWIGEPTVAAIFQPVFEWLQLSESVEHTLAFVIGFSVITGMHIVLGELVPKSLSIQKTEQIVLFVSGPLIFFDRIMYPAVWVMNHVANGILGMLGVKAASESDEAHNEEEIRLLMEESHKHGYIDKTELTYLDNVFEFSDRHASDIMVPRTEMICLFLEDAYKDNIKFALDGNMTRYPVCDEDKDHIIGYLHIKDLMRAMESGEQFSIKDLVRSALVVPESMPLSKLLRMMQKRRSHIAFVVDEYGGTAGMLTVEDILEEIVGEIQDEFDEERRSEVEDLGNKTYSVDGKLLLEEVNDVFELNLDTEDYDTIGGWMYAHCEYPPRVGQKVVVDGAELVVEEVDKVRVVRVKVMLLHEPEGIHEDIKEEYI